MEKINFAVQRLIRDIHIYGKIKKPRGNEVKELRQINLVIDPLYPIINFIARPMNFRYLLGELTWYLLRDNNVKYITNFSNFWKKIADDKGNVNSNYGHILFGKQLQWSLDCLKEDIDTRQAISFISNPSFQYRGNKDFVCTLYLNFWIEDNAINLKVQMRSNDIFYGTQFDAPFFSFVLQTIRMWLLPTYPDLKLGTYYHGAENIHYYERHYDIVKWINIEDVKVHHSFELKDLLFNLDNGEFILTESGKKLIEDANEYILSNNTSQKDAQYILNKYFNI